MQEIIAKVPVVPPAKAKADIEMAHKEVLRLMRSSGCSLHEICEKAEAASTSEEARAAFKQFNLVMGIYLNAAPGSEGDPLLRGVLGTHHLTDLLIASIGSASSVRGAIREYKVGILKRLARTIRQRVAQQRQDDELDEELFSTFLPDPVSPISVGDHSSPLEGRKSKKRVSSVVTGLTPIPKKSKIPDIASFDEVFADGSEEISTRKKVLLTREKLRAGLHDPKGLLDLVGPSTSALDRTKRLELLKGAGMSFKQTRSFSDKLNAAILRLDLGLGGHSTEDTLLLGAKVLSCPGYLPKKNTTDIENNLIHGSTSWRHQNAYAKMMIAGCMSQAKRIVEKFDEILYGPAPEQLISDTHRNIRSLLGSDECVKFLQVLSEDTSTCSDEGKIFVKKIVEAVSPIIPITLRNKTLDGGYLRTALQLLGAAEFLFAQYEQDIRDKANPAGVVGMSAAMHSEIKRSALYNEELKPLQEFAREMQSQYQTSMGLGSSFVKDSIARGRRRSRGFRGRGRYSSSHSPYQGWSRFQTFQQLPQVPLTAATNRGVSGEAAQNGPLSMRRPGICYDYRAGTCLRGGACRYRHASQ